MATTIQISNQLKNMLIERKLRERDTFEDVIMDLIEDTMELSEATKKSIAEYEKEIAKNGAENFKSLEQVKKENGL